jgi:hypothetical protein
MITTDPAEAVKILAAAALLSIRLGSGQWVHRPATGLDADSGLPRPGESVKVNGRWFHGPQIGGAA